MSNISLDIWFTSNVNHNNYKQCVCSSDFLIVCFVINLVHKILGKKKKNHDFGMNTEMPSLRLCSTSAHKSKPHKSKITYIPRPWILLLKTRRECEALPIHQHGEEFLGWNLFLIRETKFCIYSDWHIQQTFECKPSTRPPMKCWGYRDV